ASTALLASPARQIPTGQSAAQPLAHLDFGSPMTKPPKAGEEWRYSLCLGRLLKSGELSTPCYPSSLKTVKRTHDAPIEFQRAPNTFLPAGFRLDGDGVLHFEGRFEYKPKRGDLRFCAIQLKASSCDKGKFAELVLDQSFPWWADISAAGA